MIGEQTVVQATVAAAAVFPWGMGSRLWCRLQWRRQYSPDDRVADCGAGYSGGGSIPLGFGQQAVYRLQWWRQYSHDVQTAGCGAGYSGGGSIPLIFAQQAVVQVTVVAAILP